MLSRLARRLERAIWQSAQALRSRRAGSNPSYIVAQGFHERRGFVVVGVLELGGVWYQLWETRSVSGA